MGDEKLSREVWMLMSDLVLDHQRRRAVSEAVGLSFSRTRAVRRVADRYELQVGALHRTIPALLSLLAQRNLALSHLTTHSATLEDVFVSLTGRQLRDE